MRILADENVDRYIVEQLRAEGFEVKYVLEISPGLKNGEVLEMAIKEEAILLTADKDFGELVYRSYLEKGLKLKGIVLIRLSGFSLEKRAKMVSEYFKKMKNQLSGKFIVLSRKISRMRPLKIQD